MRQLIAGNWKMHMLRAPATALASGVRAGAQGLACDLLVCPPFTAIEPSPARWPARPSRSAARTATPQRTGRPYRRHLGRHAARRRRDAG